MRKGAFPQLRAKKNRLYFDTMKLPRKWIPLGLKTDPNAMKRYHELAATATASRFTISRMLREYMEHLEGGGIGPRGEPERSASG